MSHTAGYPTTRNHTPHQCFDRHFQLTCHHEYETTVPHVWCMDGIPVEHDGREFAINHGVFTATTASLVALWVATVTVFRVVTAVLSWQNFKLKQKDMLGHMDDI